MAAALSRALKLPGKKGSELGEYDPLTQADSEDESEEDDLVLNYPRNGLGRGSCMGAGTAELRGGRAGRLVEDEEDAEDDEDEWRELHPGKIRPDDLKARQYWTQRESGRDGGSAAGGGPGATGAAGLGLDSGSDPEGKRVRTRGTVRTAFFLVPLGSAMLLVLLCAFLVPCQEGELTQSPQWETKLGEIGGVNSPPLALWDVDNDTIEDVLVGVTQLTNDSQLAGSLGSGKEYSVVAVSALTGGTLWKTGLKEPVVSVQCGLQPPAHPMANVRKAFPQGSGGRSVLVPAGRTSGSVCLLIGSAHLTTVDGASGKVLWSVSPGEIVSQAVSIPDLNGDSVPDLLIATLPADQASDLSLGLLSGVSGAPIGHPVTYNLTAQGKLIGPELHVTRLGAYYILFGLGTVEAAWLMDIYMQATSRATSRVPLSPILRVKDPLWEKLKRTNSSLIHISRGKEQVEFFLPLVAGLYNNHNNLDFVSNLNYSSSDWVLVCGASKLSVLRERDVHTEWTVESAVMHSRPTPGQFNEDGIPDLLIQLSVAPGVRKVQAIDGATGKSLWEAEFVCPLQVLEGSSLMTTSGLSVFLFWAGDLQPPKNVTRATVSPGVSQGVAPADPVLRRLYLLHSAYPTILLELASTTDTILTAAVSYQEQQKDASYVTVSSRATPALKPGAQVVKSQSLRASIAGSRIVRLGEPGRAGGHVKPSAFEIEKFFRMLSFRQHQ